MGTSARTTHQDRVRAASRLEPKSEAFEEGEKPVVGPIALRGSGEGRGSRQCLRLQCKVGFQVHLCSRLRLVAKPKGDDRAVDSALQKVHCRGMPEHVWGEALRLDRRAALGRDRSVLGQAPLHGVPTQVATTRAGKERLLGRSTAVSQPRPERSHGTAAKGGATLLSSLAEAADMGAAIETDVFALQADELGDAKAGLKGKQEEGVVTTTDPSVAIWGRQQGFHFLAGEKGDRPTRVPLAGDRENTLDEG